MAERMLTLSIFTLSDAGRTFSPSVEKRVVAVETARGTKKEYVKAIKNRFVISWDWLPGDGNLNHDVGEGRDVLYGLSLAGGVLPFTVKDPGEALTRDYNVIIEDYSETLLRRDHSLGTSFYTVNMTLIEV
jgi:hypothetical protein